MIRYFGITVGLFAFLVAFAVGQDNPPAPKRVEAVQEEKKEAAQPEAKKDDANPDDEKPAEKIDPMKVIQQLKEELEKKKKPQVAKKNPDDMPPEEEPKDQPRMRNVDGIPGIAQPKVLKAEQEDLLARTSEFAKRNPDLKELNDAQRMELNELHQEQDRLRGLFREVTAPPQKEGDLP